MGFTCPYSVLPVDFLRGQLPGKWYGGFRDNFFQSQSSLRDTGVEEEMIFSKNLVDLVLTSRYHTISNT